MLWMFQRVNYGPVMNDRNRGLRDLSVREWVVIGPICALVILMGVAPGWFLAPMEPAVRRTVGLIVGPAASGPLNARVAATADGALEPTGVAVQAPVTPER
jgi:NADH-quinone oxidoreductase subunit M